jgi:hypothetical protein
MDPRGWEEEDAGPIVRPYALTGGRTRSETQADLDLVSLIEATDTLPSSRMDLGPEHLRIRRMVNGVPLSVAEVASDLNLPVGVVRVLLGDLHGHALIRVRRPASVSHLPDARLLREVIDGLNAL